MVDNIIDLESKAVKYLINNSLGAGIIALDQAAAFPSIARRYIFWVLKRMRIPKRFRRAICSLYTGGRNSICFSGKIYGHFQATSGVKQGDPSAMVLFVLAFEGRNGR